VDEKTGLRLSVVETLDCGFIAPPWRRRQQEESGSPYGRLSRDSARYRE